MRLPSIAVLAPLGVVLSPVAGPALVRSTPIPPASVRSTGAPTQDAPTGVTAFVDVAVIPMDRERVLVHQTVLVQDRHITALGPVAHVRVPAGAVRIDGRGKYLIPGLADMHAHMQVTGDSIHAIRALFFWLANGVTTIRSADYFHGSLTGAGLLKLSALAATDKIASPRIYASAAICSAGDTGWTDHEGLGSQLRSDRSIMECAAAYKAAGYDHVKIHGDEFDKEIAAAAHQVGLPVIGHLPDNTWLELALPLGYRSIEHLDGYVASLQPRLRGTIPPKEYHSPNADKLDQAHLDTSTAAITALAIMLKRAGVWSCPTQELFDIRGSDVNIDTVFRWPEFRYASPRVLALFKTFQKRNDTYSPQPGKTLDLRRRIIKALQAAGAGLLSGTDAAGMESGMLYLIPGFSLHRELAALVRAGLTPYQALATSTRNVAEYFGTLEVSGTVAVGKWADLVLLTGNPLADIRNTTRIAGVMRDGQWFERSELDRRLAALVGKFILQPDISIMVDSTCPPAAPGEPEGDCRSN